MLVSAIMPTRGRPQYAAAAVQCFLSQTWKEKELVIVDDDDCPSFPSGLDMPSVQYVRLKERLSIGAKRNLACSRARGDVVVHWDDDDWSAVDRIEDQVGRLTEQKVSITGYSSMRFLNSETGDWWRYNGVPNYYAVGTSLMYTREFWRENPFPDENLGEDNYMVYRAQKIASVDAGTLMYATIHAGNTSKREKAEKEDCWVRCA